MTLILLLCCAHGITDAFLWDLFGSLEKNSNDKASDNLQLKEEHSIAKREAEVGIIVLLSQVQLDKSESKYFTL